MSIKSYLAPTYRSVRLWFEEIVGTDHYTKFIVLTKARSGSNLLMSLLGSHPNIQAMAEIFAYVEGQSISRTWQQVYGKQFSSVKASGFKIFYYHPNDADDSVIWKWIKDDPSIHILHLKRQNLLRAHVSRQIAAQTKQWMKTSKQARDAGLDKRITVDIDACLKDIAEITRYQERAEQEFHTHPMYELTYESLAQAPETVMNSVQTFLNVPLHSLTTQTKKQNPEPLQELVINYHELAAAIAQSPWSSLMVNDMSETS